MTRTNLNILYNGTEYNNEYSNNGQAHPWSLHYVVTHRPSTGYSENQYSYYLSGDDVVFFNDGCINAKPCKNYWSTDITDRQPIPYEGAFPTATFTLLFPQHSVETYSKRAKYAITLSTWIAGKQVYLGSYIASRQDAVAITTGPERYLGSEYYECISFEVPDAWQMAYSDSWKEFRTEVCGERTFDNDEQLNNTGSNMNVTLAVVTEDSEDYMQDTAFSNAQSALAMTPDGEQLHATCEFSNDLGDTKFNVSIHYNSIYDTLAEYLRETYLFNTDGATIDYMLIVRDNEEVIMALSQTVSIDVESCSFSADSLGYTSWDEFRPGLQVAAACTLHCDGNETTIVSKSLFLTQEIFKYLITKELKHIDLGNIDMQNITFNVVNRIENQIVQVERPDERKTTVISPVFVRVQEAGAITLHGGVTESIAINLDAYKNKVSVFSIKVGSQMFYETARISAGVVFKITNADVQPGEGGVYYIVSETGELVTSGKYSVE